MTDHQKAKEKRFDKWHAEVMRRRDEKRAKIGLKRMSKAVQRRHKESVREEWFKRCDEPMLLGVSTGG